MKPVSFAFDINVDFRLVCAEIARIVNLHDLQLFETYFKSYETARRNGGVIIDFQNFYISC